MGTKNNPGAFDCYANALPDEPMFTLLARDLQFYSLVSRWANHRQRSINCGDRLLSDEPMVTEAMTCAYHGQKWRRNNNGIWRK